MVQTDIHGALKMNCYTFDEPTDFLYVIYPHIRIALGPVILFRSIKLMIFQSSLAVPRVAN